jgi:predicted nucleic acid-binding protein
MTNSRETECRIVIDTMLFVPALAHQRDEARVYNLLLSKCCKVVVSEQITEQYESVMNKYGFPGVAIFLELSRLEVMNKLRRSDEPADAISEELAPRKDKHIVAPCINRYAHYIISDDRGILERGETIRRQTGARVLSILEAEREFGEKLDCPPDLAGER